MGPAWNAALLVSAGLAAVWLVGFLLFRGPEGLRIVALCILAAVAYGILHDMLTARISIEYFTIGHPRLFQSDDPTPHALAWGVLATWWVGLLLGVPLALAARRGERPKIAARELLRPIGVLLLAMAVCAVLGAAIGRSGAQRGWFELYGDLRERVPAEKQVAFITAGGAHSASYLTGFAGGIVLIVRTWKRRALLQPAATTVAS
jgi:hypothetical protein